MTRGAAHLLAGCALVAAALMLFAFDPARSGLFPPCPFHALTGLQCPGCGTLRALHALSHGHVLSALDLNPLAMVFLVIGLAFVLARCLHMRLAPPRFAGWIVFSVIMLYWVARNVPAYPFTLLAP
jgi:hypothetical protein